MFILVLSLAPHARFVFTYILHSQYLTVFLSTLFPSQLPVVATCEEQLSIENSQYQREVPQRVLGCQSWCAIHSKWVPLQRRDSLLRDIPDLRSCAIRHKSGRRGEIPRPDREWRKRSKKCCEERHTNIRRGLPWSRLEWMWIFGMTKKMISHRLHQAKKRFRVYKSDSTRDSRGWRITHLITIRWAEWSGKISPRERWTNTPKKYSPKKCLLPRSCMTGGAMK